MASKKAENGSGHDEAGGAASTDEMPAGLVNLAARFAQYDPGIDARDIKKNFGKWGAVVHGYVLGILNMPATIPDEQTGEFKEWHALCIQLIKPCPTKVQDPENPDRMVERMAGVGEKIIMSMTSALDSLKERGLQRILDDIEEKGVVTECYIKPQASKTKAGRALWVFPTFGAGNPIPRTPDQVVSLPAVKKPALPAAAAPSHTPFRENANTAS
jgi:hypothetical protein